MGKTEQSENGSESDLRKTPTAQQPHRRSKNQPPVQTGEHDPNRRPGIQDSLQADPIERKDHVRTDADQESGVEAAACCVPRPSALIQAE